LRATMLIALPSVRSIAELATSVPLTLVGKED
jgi:hypothetical protein